MKTLKTTLWAALGLFGIAVLLAPPVAADQVINDDLIVTQSACIGNDCVNGENFGFDTLRLKENNLRIDFFDTSTSASFPKNRWRIKINDTTNGGGSFFAVEDSTAGRDPFRVDAGAPANSLRVDSAGDVGLGTSNPVVELHIADGDSPTLRLEQNGSSGFTAQTWDIAGNEANFFIRDVSNGSQLPFRIKPGADTDSLVIAANNNIGIGTDNPTSKLHVTGNNGSTELLVQETNGTAATRAMVTLENNGTTRLKIKDVSSPGLTIFQQVDASLNNYKIKTNALDLLTINVGTGDVTATSFNGVSSRDEKDVLRPVDPAAVLARLAEIPLTEWTYKSSSDALHVGPMAEDFHAAFGLGSSRRTISLMDASGIAFAAIQGLKQEIEVKDQRISDLEARLAAIEAALEIAP